MDPTEIVALVSGIASGATDASHQVEQLVSALRRRFRDRSRGSLFHTLKTELSGVLEAMDPPGTAHAVVATILSSTALGVLSDSGAVDDSNHFESDVHPQNVGKLQPGLEMAAQAKAGQQERLAKKRHAPSAVAATATPLALIFLEALPPLEISRNNDGTLTKIAERVIRDGMPLLRAIFKRQLPWLRPRVVLRIVDVYGLGEGGAPIDRAAAAEAVKTQSGGGGGRTTRWRKPIEEGGKLLQWPSSVWGCSASDDGVATPSPKKVSGSVVTDETAEMLRLAADFLVNLWQHEPHEALRTVAFILAFPTAATLAASAADAHMQCNTISSSEHVRLSPQGVVDALIKTRQWAALRQLLRAKPFGDDLAVSCRTSAVNALLEGGFTPQAEAVVAEFEMEAEFPSVADATQRSTLRRLLKQRQWSLAIDLCGHNAALRKWLVFELAASIHAPPELPVQLAHRFGFDSTIEAKLIAAIERRAIGHGGSEDPVGTGSTQFLKIGIGDDCIHMVDDLEGITLARTVLLQSNTLGAKGEQRVVGLDAEWKPSTGGNTIETGMSRVSILQLATRTHVVLLDMMTLLQHSAAYASSADLTPEETAVDSLLSDLFAQAAVSVAIDTRTILVGFQFTGDLSRLAVSYPRLPCFHLDAPVLNMVDALNCAALVYPDLGVNGRRTGLGTVIETVFGAALDKTCQCSAWEDRPLSGPQRAYAALDAWCLVRLLDVVVEQLRRDSTSSLSTSSRRGKTLTLEKAWERVHAAACPVEVSRRSTAPAEAEENEVNGDVEEAKRGAVAHGRDGVVALGVTDVENVISAAVTRHEVSTRATCATGVAGAKKQPVQGMIKLWPEKVSHAEFYPSIGQHVHVLHPEDTSASRPAVVVAAPRDELGVWLVRILDETRSISASTSENEAQEWVDFRRLVHRRCSTWSPATSVGSSSVLHNRPQPSLPPGRAAVRILDKRTVTAAEAAQELGVTPQQIGKSLAFLLCGEPLCVVLRGDDRVDRALLATELGMVSKKDRRKLTIASRNECVEIWGYPPGSMPPFGHRKPVRTIIDARLANTDGVLAVGGGSAYALVQLDAPALLELTSGEVLPITKDFDSMVDAHGVLSKRQPEAATVGAGGGGQVLQGRHGPLRGEISSSVDANGRRHPRDPMYNDPAMVGNISDGDAALVPGQKKFVVSNEMFRLARWLRVIGIDAAGLPTGGGGRAAALTDALHIAAHEGRILLTRDKKLASRKDCGASYFVSANSTKAQFMEVRVQFGLTFNDAAFMSRCAVCNGPGFNGPMTADEIVKAKHGNTVPPAVLGDVSEFWECANGSCGKIYWEGPKFSEAHSKFSGLFEPEPRPQQEPVPTSTEMVASGGTGRVRPKEPDVGISESLTPKARATMAAVARANKRQDTA